MQLQYVVFVIAAATIPMVRALPLLSWSFTKATNATTAVQNSSSTDSNGLHFEYNHGPVDVTDQNNHDDDNDTDPVVKINMSWLSNKNGKSVKSASGDTSREGVNLNNYPETHDLASFNFTSTFCKKYGFDLKGCHSKHWTDGSNSLKLSSYEHEHNINEDGTGQKGGEGISGEESRKRGVDSAYAYPRHGGTYYKPGPQNSLEYPLNFPVQRPQMREPLDDYREVPHVHIFHPMDHDFYKRSDESVPSPSTPTDAPSQNIALNLETRNMGSVDPAPSDLDMFIGSFSDDYAKSHSVGPYENVSPEKARARKFLSDGTLVLSPGPSRTHPHGFGKRFWPFSASKKEDRPRGGGRPPMEEDMGPNDMPYGPREMNPGPGLPGMDRYGGRPPMIEEIQFLDEGPDFMGPPHGPLLRRPMGPMFGEGGGFDRFEG